MKKRLLPLVIILLLAALLTLVVQDLLREAIVAPLLYVVWVVRLVFESIPQLAIWLLFLVITLPVAVKSLLKKIPPAPPVAIPETWPSKRIGVWLHLLRRANQDDYYRWQLAQRLQKLTVTALAHDERVTPRQVRQRLANGELALPPELQTYLQAGMTSFGSIAAARPRWRWRKKPQPSPLALDPAQIIQFLEDKIDYHPD